MWKRSSGTSSARTASREGHDLLAHSVGAVIVAAWVHDFAPRIRGLVLATPAFRVRLYVPFAVPCLRLRQRLLGPGYVKSYVKAKMLTHDARAGEALRGGRAIFPQIAVNILLGLHDTGTRLVADAAAIRVPCSDARRGRGLGGGKLRADAILRAALVPRQNAPPPARISSRDLSRERSPPRRRARARLSCTRLFATPHAAPPSLRTRIKPGSRKRTNTTASHAPHTLAANRRRLAFATLGRLERRHRARIALAASIPARRSITCMRTGRAAHAGWGG